MHHLSIIEPTGNGDLLNPWGHRCVGGCDADELGYEDAYLEYGEEVRESVFQIEAAELLLEVLQENATSILVVADNNDEDPEILTAEETEWGSCMLIPPHSYKH